MHHHNFKYFSQMVNAIEQLRIVLKVCKLNCPYFEQEVSQKYPTELQLTHYLPMEFPTE